MVDRQAAEAGIELVRGSRLSVGLHVVLDSRGELLVPPEDAPRELERQLVRFEELVGRAPSHVDSHHHIHRDPRVLPAFLAFADRHALPLRDHSIAHHRPMFYGRWDDTSHVEQVSVDSLLGILDGIGDGATEIGCHPGYAQGLNSRYKGRARVRAADADGPACPGTGGRERHRADRVSPAVTVTLDALAREAGTFLMVAMDQRESLRTMLAQHGHDATDERMVRFKLAVARELAPYASGFLIDRHFGYREIVRDRLVPPSTGLILAADALEQPPGGVVEDTDLDEGVDAETARENGVVALKLLIVWRDDERRARRVETARRFVELAHAHGLLSVLEPVVRAENREDAIVEAARELGGIGCDLYKCEVPTHGAGEPEEITEWSRKIDSAVPCPWVVLSQGVDPDRYPMAVEAACRGGASGMLAGRAVWTATLGADDPTDLLRKHSVPRLRELGEIVDRHGRPWCEKGGAS